MLRVGDKAPGFSVEDTDGNKLVADDLLAGGPIILAFFPKAFTPG